LAESEPISRSHLSRDRGLDSVKTNVEKSGGNFSGKQGSLKVVISVYPYLQKTPNFSRFYKKLGPFYKKLRCDKFGNSSISTRGLLASKNDEFHETRGLLPSKK